MIRRLAVLLLALLPAAAATAAVTINPEVDRYAKALEAKVKADVDRVLGPANQAIVSVMVRESRRPPPQLGQATDIGYLALPMTSYGESGGEKGFTIDSVTADIQVPDATPDAALAELKKVVGTALKGLNPVVNVEKYVVPPAEEKKREEASLLRNEAFLKMLAVVLAALILASGVILIGNALRTAAGAIADGMGHMKTTTQAALQKREAADKARAEEAARKRAQPPKPPTWLKDYSRNVGVLRKVLQGDAAAFARAAGDEDRDLRGLKWVLPNLSEAEQASLKQCLGAARLARMNDVPAGPPEEDLASWLQGFVERLVLKRVQGGSFVEETIGPERTLKFLTAKPAALVRAAEQVDEKGAWRLAAEFIPRDEMEKLLGQIDERKWAHLLGGSEVAADELAASAERMLEALARAPDAAPAEDHKQAYLSRKLVEPAVGWLLNQELGKDDEFLENVGRSSPEFVEMIQAKLWTPRRLALVPDAYLAAVLKPLGTDKKVALVHALPEEQANRVLALIPEGNARVIVVDQMKKRRTKRDPAELKAATSVCRQFLDQLRRDAEAGKLKLLNDSEARAEARKRADAAGAPPLPGAPARGEKSQTDVPGRKAA